MPRILLTFVLVGLCSVSLSAQVTPPQAQQTSTPAAAKDDPQAVSIVNQVLAAAGGTQAIAAVKDYSVSGTVTYYEDAERSVQGPVTIKALGSAKFRMDANLPDGARSWVEDQGSANALESLKAAKMIPSADYFPVRAPMFPGGLAVPYLELSIILKNPKYYVLYKGEAQINGVSAYDIQVHRAQPPGAKSPATQYDSTKDYFIDPSTFQIVVVQDTGPKLVVRQIQYSNYTAEGGVLVPSSIIETVAGHQLWSVQLNTVVFNSGLQASAFAK